LLKTPIQFLISASSLVIFSLLTIVMVNADNQQDYDSLAKSINFIEAWLAAFILGIIMIFIRKKYKKLLQRGIFYNIIGTFNMFITVIGVPYIYGEMSNKISAGLLFFVPTLVIGLLIWGDIYFIRKPGI